MKNSNYSLLILLIFFCIIKESKAQDSVKRLPAVYISDSLKKTNKYLVKPISRIERSNIENLSLTNNLPEIVSKTAGISYSNCGGGVGDGEIRMRGYDHSNILLTINDNPEGEPDNGWIYWSNYTGLEDFAKEITIERGISNTHYLSRPGGAVNITTISGDEKRESLIGYTYGNLTGNKFFARTSSGILSNDFYYAAGVSRNYGSTYAEGTRIDGFTFYLSGGKKINKNNIIEFKYWNTPQNHWQNTEMKTDSVFKKYGRDYNSTWGYQDGDTKSAAINFYSRSVFDLKFKHIINNNNIISVNGNYDYGNGGAVRSFGSGLPLDANGHIDFDKAISLNTLSTDTINLTAGGIMTGNNSDYFLGKYRHKSHKFGVNAYWNSTIAEKNTLRIGAYAYENIAYDYGEVADMLGGDFIEDYSDINNPQRAIKEGDRIWYNGYQVSNWIGSYFETTHNGEKWNLMASGTAFLYKISNYDYFGIKESDGQKKVSDPFLGLNIKAGSAYKINKNFSAFANGGFYRKKPRLVFVDKETLDNMPAEKQITVEGGIKYNNKTISAVLNGYFSRWIDRTNVYWGKEVSTGKDFAVGLSGIMANNSGIEAEIEINIDTKTKVAVNGYIGNWKYTKDFTAHIKDPQNQAVDTATLYLKDLPFGGQPQNGINITASRKLFKNTDVVLDFNAFDNLYADFDIFSLSSKPIKPYEMDSWNVFNFSVFHTINLPKSKALKLSATIKNLFDTKYYSLGWDGSAHDKASSYFYAGQGRTFAISAIFSM